MKHSFGQIACLIILGGPAGSAAERLQNTGFDSWANGVPTGWSRAGDCLITEVELEEGNSAVQLGSGSASETQALVQSFTAFGGGFSFALTFSQQAPAGGLRGMNVSLRSSSGPIMSIRSSASGALEIFNGPTSSWIALAGTTGAISPSGYDDGNPSNDPVYRVEIDGNFATGTYSIRLIDGGSGAAIASASNLAYWQSPPTAATTLRTVQLERGRSGADWRAYRVSLDEPAAEEPFIVDPNPIHPFLIVSAEEYPSWRQRALREPWATMKTKALADAASLAYDPTFSGSYRSKILRLKRVVSACALASILDPANAQAHKVKAAQQMIAGLTDIRDTRGSIGGWDANTPVGSTLFSCILALDVFHPLLDEATRLQIENLIGPLVGAISGWDPSPASVRCLWALYRGDAAAYQSNVSSYLNDFLDLFTNDGVMVAGTGYGNARLNYYDREQKHALTDILARLGALDTYSIKKVQRVYEWLYGSAYGHQGEIHVFGDTSANRPLWGPADEYPEDSPTAAYRAWRYSHAAQAYANRLIIDPSPQPSLLGFALIGDATRDLPATSAPSRIFPDGGAFFREATGDPAGLSSGLLNLTRAESHTHKETNSISLIGHGEHLVSNAGYAGYATASLGFPWNYINNRALSANTVLIDYPVTLAKDASATKDHTRKYGAGIVRGLVSGGFDYAVGDSGGALADGVHQRGMAFVHPDAVLGTPGYWLLLDQVTSATGSNAHLALHPFSADVSTIAANQHYRWFIRKQTAPGTHLSVHLAAAPSQVQVLDGVLANLDPTKSFLGKFLYATYPIQSGNAHFATALLPHQDPEEHPAVTRPVAAGHHHLAFHWPLADDEIFSAAPDAGPQTSGEISWTGSACYVRWAAGQVKRFFLDEGISFSARDVSLTSTSPAVVIGEARQLAVSLSAPATITFKWPGVHAAFRDHSTVPLAPDGDGVFSVELPAGDHRLHLGHPAMPAVQLRVLPDTVVLGIGGLQPGKPYRYEASPDLIDWVPLKEGSAPSPSDFLADPVRSSSGRFYRIVLPQNP